MLGDELYKRSPLGVLMKCIPTNQGKQLLLKVHARICRHHMAPRSLVRKGTDSGSITRIELMDSLIQKLFTRGLTHNYYIF